MAARWAANGGSRPRRPTRGAASYRRRLELRLAAPLGVTCRRAAVARCRSAAAAGEEGRRSRGGEREGGEREGVDRVGDKGWDGFHLSVTTEGVCKVDLSRKRR